MEHFLAKYTFKLLNDAIVPRKCVSEQFKSDNFETIPLSEHNIETFSKYCREYVHGCHRREHIHGAKSIDSASDTSRVISIVRDGAFSVNRIAFDKK